MVGLIGDGQLDRRPNLFILGAAKCGTTSLHDTMGEHEQIFLTKNKEPHFFDDAGRFAEGFAWYVESHFHDAYGFPVRGEATPYFGLPNLVGPRILESCGRNVKFVLVLRDPVMRAWSHYQHCVRRSTEAESFERALELEASRLATDPLRWIGYFRDGLYATLLKQWQEYFPHDHFRVLLMEDLMKESSSVLNDLCRWLNVPERAWSPEIRRLNEGGNVHYPILSRFLARPIVKEVLKTLIPRRSKSKLVGLYAQFNTERAGQRDRMSASTERILRERYTEEIKELEHMIGRQLSQWYQPRG